MLPTPKGPGDHHVAKHTSRFVSRVLGRPGLHQWAGAQSNLHSRSWLFDRARAFDDAGIFPGRSEQRERVGLSVPGINNVRGRGHLAAINKQFAHKLTSNDKGLQAAARNQRRDSFAAPWLERSNASDCRNFFPAASFFKYASQKASEAELVYPRIAAACEERAEFKVSAVMKDM